jgi:hypothetical protein
MTVHNLDVVSVCFSPHKTNAPLVIDADTVLPFAVCASSSVESGSSVMSRIIAEHSRSASFMPASGTRCGTPLLPGFLIAVWTS